MNLVKILAFLLLLLSKVSIVFAQNNCSIGSQVFVDANDNGVFDANEDNIGELGETVSLNLINANTGSQIVTTTTDSNGEYVFDNLNVGNYLISFFPPTSMPRSSTVTNSTDNQNDNDNNGAQVDTDGDGVTDGVINSPIINIGLGTEPINDPGLETTPDANGDNTIDFGLVPSNCSIGSQIFVDANDNGIFDTNEDNIGVVGETITFELIDGSTGLILSSTTTDSNGEYVFDNIEPGDYFISFFPPLNFRTSSTPTDSSDNQEDNDDNGSQIDTDGDGVTDGIITSPVINLAIGTEPIDDQGIETTPDANGDNTIDFGLIPYVPEPDNDWDNDGVENSIDSCPNNYNPFQEDIDGDGIGDECDPSNIVTQLHEVEGNIYADKIYSGIILKDDTGNCWMIVVQQNGSLKTIDVECPN